MGAFDKKVKKLRNSQLIMAYIALTMSILFLVLWIIEIFPKKTKYTDFNNKEASSTYAKAEVKYLMGPLLQVSNKKTGEKYRFYLTEGKDEKNFVVRFKGEETLGIPILGQDVLEENLGTLQEIEIQGTEEVMSGTLQSALMQKINADFNKEVVTDNNIIDYFGIYYLDTAPEKKHMARNRFIAFAVFGVTFLLYFTLNRRIRKSVDNTINMYKQKGKLPEIKKEYDSGNLIEYKKVKVSMSRNYIFSYTNGLAIIKISNIKNVYATKKFENNYTRYKYIILEMRNGDKYFIAPLIKRRQKITFNELVSKIEASINK